MAPAALTSFPSLRTIRLRTTRRTTTVIKAMRVTVALAPRIWGPLFSSGRPAPGAGMVDIGVLVSEDHRFRPLRSPVSTVLDSTTDAMDWMRGPCRGYMAVENCPPRVDHPFGNRSRIRKAPNKVTVSSTLYRWGSVPPEGPSKDPSLIHACHASTACKRFSGSTCLLVKCLKPLLC